MLAGKCKTESCGGTTQTGITLCAECNTARIVADKKAKAEVEAEAKGNKRTRCRGPRKQTSTEPPDVRRERIIRMQDAGLTYEAIAVQVGVTVGQVSGILSKHRAKQRSTAT